MAKEAVQVTFESECARDKYVLMLLCTVCGAQNSERRHASNAPLTTPVKIDTVAVLSACAALLLGRVESYDRLVWWL